jgi:DHA2 family multidrug resistance protein-like MFS transporter
MSIRARSIRRPDMTSTKSPRATTREWIGLAVLALPTLLVSIDVSVMVLALPHIGSSLGADSAQQLWIMDIYGFLLGGFMITMGTLGDRIGRRKLLVIGAAGFGLASIAAAFAPTAEVLIGARALLGIAGATISPSILALITNMFRDEKQRGFAISVWMVCFMGGMAIGPLVGGMLLESFWWGSVFLLGVPAMLLLLVTAPFLLPEYKAPSAGRIDLPSVGLSLLTILPAIYGLKEIAKHGPAPIPVLAIAAGLGFGSVFLRRQRLLDDPLLDVALFKNRRFTSAVVAVFGITLTGGLMLFTSQYLQLVLGLSPLHAGMWTLPGVATMVIALLVAPIIAQRVRPGRLITGGLVVATFGALLLTRLEPSAGVAPLVIAFILLNGGCAPLITLGNGIILTTVDPQRAGSAAALSETSAELGFALGIAALGSLFTAIYRGALVDTLPAGLSASTADLATDTLAGAAAVAHTLPAQLGEPLLAAARTAFTDGIHVLAFASAAVLACVTVITALRFRSIPRLGAIHVDDASVTV